MKNSMTRGEENLLLLQSLFPENEKLYAWCYWPDGRLAGTSCPKQEKDLLEPPFHIFEILKKARDHAESSAHDRPLMIGSPIGMQWAVTFESEGHHSMIFVIGPVFYTSPDKRQLRSALRPYSYDPDTSRWTDLLCSSLPDLPVMSYAIFCRYVLIIHNTLTGRQCGLDDLFFGDPEKDRNLPTPEIPHDRMKVYHAECAMLQMVRTGNINYQTALQDCISLSPGTLVRSSDPLRQMKISITVFTTLVCRAAMEGGLSPEVAYPLGDSYIQSAENCCDSGELSSLANAMYHDFIYRVHHLHANPNYSHEVQKCCDYIELSLERQIRLEDLASLCGYTEYYLTEKFKKETGQSMSRYIRNAKMERAKVLLKDTDLKVWEIAERLAFNTVNYFIQCFREATGDTPTQYRKKYK